MSWHFLPVSRDRYEAAMREVSRLQRRCEKLEDALDVRAMAVLQSSLRKNGMMQVGERDEMVEMADAAPRWTPFENSLFEAWKQDFQRRTGGTDGEAMNEWRQQYGDGLPSRVLA